MSAHFQSVGANSARSLSWCQCPLRLRSFSQPSRAGMSPTLVSSTTGPPFLRVLGAQSRYPSTGPSDGANRLPNLGDGTPPNTVRQHAFAANFVLDCLDGA